MTENPAEPQDVSRRVRHHEYVVRVLRSIDVWNVSDATLTDSNDQNNLVLLEVVDLVQLSLEHDGEVAFVLVVPLVGRGASLDGGGVIRKKRDDGMKRQKP